MYSKPVILNDDNEGIVLEPYSYQDTGSEALLQKRLFEASDALPTQEIDPAYRAIAPLCMEMNTPAGPIDIVYVTPEGLLVVVETKLWRNPEARRKVIGQILDYAKELISWTYADLQREVSRRTGIKGNAPYLLAKQKFENLDEADFVDGVSKSLSMGKFMLLIAGDGIREDAQGIVQFLENTAHMRFTLALVEVAMYSLPHNQGVLMHPRVISKTQIIERALDSELSISGVPISYDKTQTDSELGSEYRIFWQSFIDQLSLDDPSQSIANVTGQQNMFFSLPPSGGIAWITLYFYKRDREIGCFVRFINKPAGHDLYSAICERREDINSELSFEPSWSDDERKIKRTMNIKEGEWPPLSNPIVTDFFSDTVNQFVNAFRPRLLDLC